MKTVLHLLLTGTDSLAAERKDSLAGAAKEGTMLAALKLLRTALQVDREMVLALRNSQQHGAQPFRCHCQMLSWCNRDKQGNHNMC